MKSSTHVTKPYFAINLLGDVLKDFVALQEQIAVQASTTEDLISKMDKDIARALHEDNDKSPLYRLITYRMTLWAQHGWFASMYETPLQLISQTAEILGKTQHNMAEDMIAAYFESERKKLIQLIVEKYPQRRTIINDALAAHDEGRFSLSIPVFLTQADGIGTSYFEIDSIYTLSKENFLKIKLKFDSQCDALKMRYLYFLLATLTPLNASRGKRSIYKQPFNRHMVIHGQAIDYPKKVNSLKSISWLSFVCDLVHP